MSWYGNETPYCPDARKIIREEDGNHLKVYDYLMETACHQSWIVGRFRRISEQALKELLEVSECNGRKRKPGTRGLVRSVLSRLKKLGLILELETYVFSLPYEQAYFSVQKRYNPSSTQGTAEQLAAQGIVFTEEQQQQLAQLNTSNNQRCNPPLINKSINKNKGADYFLMRMDWVPSEQFVDVAKAHMFDAKATDRALMLEALADLRVFWTLPETLDNPKYKHERSQQAWEQALLKKMVYLKANPTHPDVNPIASPGITPKGNKPDAFTVPKDNNDLVSWAAKHGYPASGSMSFYDYRQSLYKAVDERRNGKPASKQPDPLEQRDAEQKRAMAEKAADTAHFERMAKMAGVPVETLTGAMNG